jgi:hypothetical protein
LGDLLDPLDQEVHRERSGKTVFHHLDMLCVLLDCIQEDVLCLNQVGGVDERDAKGKSS